MRTATEVGVQRRGLAPPHRVDNVSATVLMYFRGMTGMARIAWAVALGLVVGAGCNFDSMGADRRPAPGLGVQASTGDAPDPAQPSNDTDDGGAGITAGGGGTTGMPPNPTDPSGDPDPTSDPDPTVGGTGGDDSGNASGGGTGGANADSGDMPPTEAFVNNTDLGSCTSQIGCWGPNRPAGPFTALECFDSPVPPPYQVTEVAFDVGWIDFSFDDLGIILYDRQPNGLPGNVVLNGGLTAPPDTGMNDIPLLGLAPTVNTDGFCVALRIPDGGWDGGLEFGTNPSQPVSSGSYYGNCGVDQWTGLGASWCFGAQIEAVN